MMPHLEPKSSGKSGGRTPGPRTQLPDTTRKHVRGRGKGKVWALNMCRQIIVDAPLDLKRELEEFDRTKDRSVLIKAVIDQFLITRYVSATLVEKSRIAALEILIGRMPNMSDNMLIKTIETLTQIAEVDISSSSGEVKR
jgi:hypothetical protein